MLFKKSFNYFCGIMVLLLVSGCGLLPANVTVASINVDPTTFSDTYYLEDFDLTTIHLIVEMSDGTTQSVVLDETMISSDDLAKLSTEGTHTITIQYQGQSILVDITIIPYVPIVSTIYFETDCDETIDSIQASVGTVVIQPTPPTKVGYDFMGWFTVNDRNQPFVFSTMPQQNVTLYAKWHITVNDVSYELLYHQVTVIGYTGTQTTLVLPDELDSFPITIIADNVFKNNTTLESVTIGALVQRVGNEAFSQMTQLEYIGLSGKTIIVGQDLLYGCTQLETLILSSQAPYPLAYYFGGDINDVPNTLTKIKHGNGSIGFDSTLTDSPMNQITLELADDVTKVDESQFFESEHIYHIIIPSNIIEIEAYAFFDSSIKYIDIEENSQLTTIGMHAFDQLDLTYFILPSTVTNIGYSAFEKTSNAIYTYASNPLPDWDNECFFVSQEVVWDIKEHGVDNELVYVVSKDDEALIVGQVANPSNHLIVIPNTMNTYPVSCITPYAFYQSQIQSIQLGENVIIIGESAFRDAGELTSIDFGQNSQLESIEAYAFINCDRIESLHFPASLKYIDGVAFHGVSALQTITFEDNSQLERIGNACFTELPLLKAAYIPKDAILEQGAFENCPNITFYIYADELPSTWNPSWYLGTSFPPIYWGVKYMGTDGDFDYFINADDEVVIQGQNNNSTQTNLVIPSDISGKPVTIIKSFAFSHNTSLLSIELPATIHTIEEKAFFKATALTSIFIPNTVINMGYMVFLDCSTLTIYAQPITQPVTWNSQWHAFNPVVWGHLAPYQITYYGYTPYVAIDKMFLCNFQTSFITTDHRLFTLGNDNGIPEDITDLFSLNSGESIIKMIEADVNSGDNQYYALTSEGRLFSWGANTYGQLGDGTTDSKTTPNDITALFDLNPSEMIVSITSGTYHAMAITSHNRVFTWGRNDNGQLGDNSTVDHHLPNDITSHFNFESTDHIVQIESASSHNILLTESGKVYSWGYNNLGQLGNGNTTSQFIPMDITQHFPLANGEKIVYIDTSYSHTLSISNLYHVYTWGNNQNGQLGYDRAILYPYNIHQELQLQTGEFIIQVAAGQFFSLFLTSSGRVMACGRNSSGQLGANSEYVAIRELTDVTAQFDLIGNEKIVNVYAGASFGMAITSGGSIFGWGYNYNGQIGYYGASIQRKPIQITSLFQEEIEITTETFLHQETIQWLVPQAQNGVFLGWFLDNTFETPAIDVTMPAENVTVYGKWNANMHAVVFDGNGGTLINGNPFQLIANQDDAIAPTYEREGYNFIGFDLAFNTVTDNLSVSAQWQIKTYTVTFDVNGGSLVDGSLTQVINHGDDAILPTLSKEGYHYQWTNDASNVTQDVHVIAQWTINTYVITFDGDGGDLLTGDSTYTITHGQSITGPTFEKIGHTFVGFDVDFSQITSDLLITAQWSINEYTLSLNANNGTTITTITQEYGTVVDAPTIPLKTGHQFDGWYQDIDLTQLFDFTTMPAENLTLYGKWKINQYQITYYEEAHVDKFFSGDQHSFIVLSDGRIIAFGSNLYSELGVFTAYDSAPVDITSRFNFLQDESILKMAAGFQYSVAITTKGRIFVWGDNTNGKLGDGTTQNKQIPTDITAQFNLNPNEVFVEVFAGFNHTVVVTSQHRIFTWGQNDLGQLGNQTNSSASTPTDITSFIPFDVGETPLQVVGGQAQTWILTSNHRLIAWGYHALTTQKDGTPVLRTHPTDVTSQFNLIQNEVIVKLNIGSFHVTALTSHNRLFLWGDQHNFRYADNTTPPANVPTDITNEFDLLTNETISSVSCGKYHTQVTTSSNRVFMWGNNHYGQIGDGTTTQRYQPVEITSHVALANDTIVSFILKNETSFALSAKGDLYTWGRARFVDGVIQNSLVMLNMDQSFDLFGIVHTEAIDYEETISLFNPSQTGYAFSGWFTDEACLIPFQLTTMPDNDIQLYGKQSIVSYQVTFNGNGGTLLYGNEQQQIIHGSAAQAPVYDKPGYLFNGFDMSLDSITSSTQFIAQWLDFSTLYYQVTFDGNGGILMDGDDQQSVLHGQSAIEPLFEKPGYVMIAWDYAFDYVTDHLIIHAIWESDTGTLGLEFTLLADDTYEVTGYTGTNTSIVIPSMYQGVMVTSIGEQAFEYNNVIEHVYIMENIKIIKEYAFSLTSNLKTITLPNHLETIESSAFYNTGLIEIVIPDTVTTLGHGAFANSAQLKSVVLPNGITSISPWLFRRCGSLETIVIPDSVTAIEAYAFAENSQLTSVIFSDNITTIGENAFEKCSLLDNVLIPNQVVSIGTQAFASNSSLKNLTIGSSVTSIGYEAFSNCDSLTNLVLPDSIITIGGGAFSYCDALVSVHFGNGIQTLNDFAFNGCNLLTSIDLPSSLTRIKYAAFRDCATLSSITLRSTTPPTLDNVNGLPSTNNFIIYVPADSLAAYQVATNWSQYSQNMQPIS